MNDGSGAQEITGFSFMLVSNPDNMDIDKVYKESLQFYRYNNKLEFDIYNIPDLDDFPQNTDAFNQNIHPLPVEKKLMLSDIYGMVVSDKSIYNLFLTDNVHKNNRNKILKYLSFERQRNEGNSKEADDLIGFASSLKSYHGNKRVETMSIERATSVVQVITTSEDDRKIVEIDAIYDRVIKYILASMFPFAYYAKYSDDPDTAFIDIEDMKGFINRFVTHFGSLKKK